MAFRFNLATTTYLHVFAKAILGWPFDEILTYSLYVRIFLAGKKVMQIALGRSSADEAKTGLHKLSKVTFSFLNTWHIIQSTPFL